MSFRMSFVLACAAAMAVAGCTTVDPNTGERVPNRAGTGAILGAIGGAAAGTMAGGDDRRNAIIGAGIGALAGAAVGGYMDEQERQLRERLAQQNIQVERVAEDQIRLVMPADLTFDFDSADVRGQFRPVLMDVASVLEAHPSTMIDVIGHADSIGTDAYNQTLSERRAMAVSSVLINNGVQRERVVAYGRGETQPVASNDTDAGRQANRRVEVRVRALTQS